MSYKDFLKFLIEFFYAIWVVVKFYPKRCLTNLMDFARQQKMFFEIPYSFLQIPSPSTIPDFHNKSQQVKYCLVQMFPVFFFGYFNNSLPRRGMSWKLRPTVRIERFARILHPKA